MKQKVFSWMLMAALVCGLSWSFTACSDDDDDKNNNSSTDERNEQVMSTSVSDDESVLGSLLPSWVEDFSADDVVAGIINKTYTATVGEVADASQPTVRTLVVGTEAKATATAAGMLSVLGFNPQSPYGFSWSNSAIGTVGYQRGTGNELAVINVSVKQVPGLTKIRLVKDYEGNAPAEAYYSHGDIVKYTKDNKYYICTSDHVGGVNSTWVSFDTFKDQKKQSTSTCSWRGYGKDVYFDKQQASSQALAVWLRDFVLNEDGYLEVLNSIKDQPLDVINQIIPSNDLMRQEFVRGLIQTKSMMILDVNALVGQEVKPRVEDYWQREDAEFVHGKDGVIVKTTPFGQLLADVMRWKMGFTFQYWVPTVVIALTRDDLGDTYIKTVKSQYEESSHFLWKELLGSVDYDGSKYDIFLTAIHWTHDPVNNTVYGIDGQSSTDPYYYIIDFTQLSSDDLTGGNEDDYNWTYHNITSHELQVKDKGTKYSKFETIYRAAED